MARTTATITCPACGHVAEEQMQTDACQFFYVCHRCGDRLRPKPGDCCVFCSYADIPCPPVQKTAIAVAGRLPGHADREPPALRSSGEA